MRFVIIIMLLGSLALADDDPPHGGDFAMPMTPQQMMMQQAMTNPMMMQQMMGAGMFGGQQNQAKTVDTSEKMEQVKQAAENAAEQFKPVLEAQKSAMEADAQKKTEQMTALQQKSQEEAANFAAFLQNMPSSPALDGTASAEALQKQVELIVGSIQRTGAARTAAVMQQATLTQKNPPIAAERPLSVGQMLQRAMGGASANFMELAARAQPVGNASSSPGMAHGAATH